MSTEFNEAVNQFKEKWVAPHRTVILSALVAGFILASLFVFFLIPNTSTVTIRFEDQNHVAVKNVLVVVRQPFSKTLESNASGTIEVIASPNDTIFFRAEKPGFSVIEANITPENRKPVHVFELESASKTSIQTIVFSGLDNQKIVGKQLEVRLSCANLNASMAPAEKTVSSEDPLPVTLPKDCGGLVVSVVSPVEYAGYSYSVSAESGLIRLKTKKAEAARPGGSLTVRVTAEKGSVLASDLEAVLFLDSKRLSEQTVQNGSVVFENLEPGKYAVRLHDRKGVWADAVSEIASLSSGKKGAVSVSLRQAVGKISMQTSDASSSFPVAGAWVSIVNPSTNALLGIGQTDHAGKIVFSFSQAVPSGLVADIFAQGYSFLSRRPVTEQNEYHLIPVQKKSVQIVRVVDSSGQLLENARVFAANPDSFEAFSSVSYQATDHTGTARFEGLSGPVGFVGSKGLLSGKSGVVEIGKGTEVRIVLVSSAATMQIRVTDESAKGIAGAQVSVKNRLGGISELKTGSNGSVGLNANEGDEVQLSVSKEGFSRVETDWFWVQHQSERIVVLSKPSSRVLIEWEGVFDPNGKPVTSLSPKSRYLARIAVSVPDDSVETGVMMAVGNKTDVTEENAFISFVDSTGMDISMGKKLDSTLSETELVSAQNLDFSKAKWVLLRQFNPKPGKRLVGVWFETTAGFSEPLEIQFRAWNRSAGGIQLDPADSQAQAKQKPLLFSNMRAITVAASGLGSDCLETICVSNLQLETESEVDSEPPFDLASSAHGSLHLSVKNTSSENLNELSFSVAKTQDDAATPLFTVQEIRVAGQKKDAPVLFDLKAGEEKEIEVVLEGKTTGPFGLKLSLLNREEPLWEREIAFNPSQNRSLKMNLDALSVPAFSPFLLSIVVQDAATLEAVPDALVTIERTSPDGSVSVSSMRADSLGTAEFDFTGVPNGTSLYITSSSDGFDPSSATLMATPLLSFSPPFIGVLLSGENRDEKAVISVQNLTTEKIKVNRIDWTGNFFSIINMTKLLSDADAFSGSEIGSGGFVSAEYAFNLHSAFSPTVDESFSGTHLVEAALGVQKFVFVLPVEVTVKANPQTANAEDCLKVSQSAWSGNTVENRSDFAFVLENNCDEDFSSLESQVVWDKNPIGNIELSFDQQSPVALADKQWASLAETVPKKEFAGILTFTPGENELGQEAKFTVYLAGVKRSDKARVFSKTISASIAVTNLENCLVYSPHPGTGLSIEYGKESAFSLDASGCGELDLSVELCKDDPGCSGGAPEGKISVEPLEFDLGVENPVQEIRVKGMDLPGTYDIGVFAQTPSIDFVQISTMAIRIKTDPNAFLDLEKTEFFLKGAGKTDSAQVENRNLSTIVNVEARAEDWARLSGENLAAFSLAGTGLSPAGASALVDAATEAKNQAAELARSTAQQMEQAQQLSQQAMNQQNDSAQKTSDAEQQVSTAAGLGSQGVNMIQMLSTQCAAVETACVTPIYPACQGIPQACAAAQSIFGALKGAEGAGNAAAGAVQEALEQTGPPGVVLAKGQKDSLFRILLAGANAVGSAQTALTEINSAEQTAAVETSAELSQGAESASGLGASSCQNSNQAQQSAQEAGQKTGQAGMNLGLAGASIGMSVTQAAAMEASMGSCTCPAAVSMKNQFYAFKGVQTSLDGTNVAATSAANDQAKPSQQQAQMGSQAASAAACAASEQLNKFADASEQLSGDLNGENEEVTQNIAAILAGGVSTGYLEGIYRPDDVVRNQLTGFVINLKADAKTVSTGTEKVSGVFETTDASVVGEYKTQSAGVVFSNKSLEEETIFATVVLDTNLHEYADPTVVPAGATGWGPFQLESLSEVSSHQQKFHVKFTGKEEPQVIEQQGQHAVACQSGALLGRTGPDALPRIKLKWNWTDITLDSCDAKNPDFIYCDATQFSIMMTKRLYALREFLSQNTHLSCPTNTYQVNLDAEMSGFNRQLNAGFASANYVSGCWLPRSTRLFDKRSALEYFVEATPDISWTDDVPNVSALHDLLFFDAYLIQDGYSPDFGEDFTFFFSNVAFADTPNYFFNDPSKQNMSEFFDKQKISFSQKFSGSDQLPTSGLFSVETNADFSEEWSFFGANQVPSASFNIEFLYEESGQLDSPFYYLPFDGEVGVRGEEFERNGYGVGYDVLGDNEFRISRASEVHTRQNSGTAFQQFSVLKKSSFGELNLIPSRRGYILDVYQNSNTKKTGVFSPSIATPVLLKVHQDQSLKPFSALYSLRIGDNAMDVGEQSAFWSGAGACLDFDGKDVADNWRFSADRRGQASDHVTGAEKFYGISWPKADEEATVYLKTVFFLPIGTGFDLRSETLNVRFLTADELEASSVKLGGISTMAFNRRGSTATDHVTALDDLFDLVFEQKVCVTNTGIRSSFWWNPDAVFEQRGLSGKSIDETESGLVSGTTCR